MDFTKILFAGFGTYLTPCVYPLIPIYLSSLMGMDMENVKGIHRGQLLARSLAFSLGFIMVFSIMGLGAAGIGRFLQEHRGIFQLVAGIFVLMFALKFLGVIEIPFMNRTIRKDDSKMQKVGLLSAFLMGFFFAAGWSPCIGPILGSVLTYTASQTADPFTGLLYLTTYGVGFAIPLILTAVFAESGVGFIHKTSRFLPWFERIIGVVLIFAALNFFSSLLSGYDTYKECSMMNDPLYPRGKPIMVEFYSKNCSICQKMKPIMDDIKSTCRARAVEIKELDISEPQYAHMKKSHHLLGVPTFVFLDEKGKEVSRLIGAQTTESLQQALSVLMGEQCPAVGPLPANGKGSKEKSPSAPTPPPAKDGHGAGCGADNPAAVPLCTE